MAVALWWSGLLAPRLDIGDGSAGSFDQETLEGDVQLSVRNAGPLPLRIEQVTVGGPGYRSTGAALLAPDPDPDAFGGNDLPAFEPTDLAPGESAELRIGFAVDGCRTDDPHLEARVRTATGLRRSVDLGGSDRMEMYCVDAPPDE